MEIQAEKERIYRIIDQMPESKAREVIALVDDIDNDPGAPESVVVHSHKELINRLNEGLEAAERGEMYSLREVASRIENKYFSV